MTEIIEQNNRYQFSSVQLLSHVRLFATPWTAACQAFLSITSSWSLLKLMSIESVMPSNHLILCCPLLLLLSSIFPSIRLLLSQLFASGGQSIGVSASASVLPMNIQDRFPENRLVVAKLGEGVVVGGEWNGRLGLSDASYYI